MIYLTGSRAIVSTSSDTGTSVAFDSEKSFGSDVLGATSEEKVKSG